MHRRAFTVIELLVVTTIIAVLAGLLLPAIAAVKFQAYGARCGSDKRQAIMAILAYAQDWNGIAPTCMVGKNNQGKQKVSEGHTCTKSLWGLLYEYTGTMAIARCPADKKVIDLEYAHYDGVDAGGIPVCPSPESCRGRPILYMAWNCPSGDPNVSPRPSVPFAVAYQKPDGVINSTYKPFRLVHYKSKMQLAFTNKVDGSNYLNRFTGLTQSGARLSSVPNVGATCDVYGSTLLLDSLTPMEGPHARGAAYFGWNLTSSDGVVRWRTRSLPSSGAYDGFLYNRFEEE